MINIPSKMDEYCKEKGFAGWFETSAKENINIEEAAKFLVNKVSIKYIACRVLFFIHMINLVKKSKYLHMLCNVIVFNYKYL